MNYTYWAIPGLLAGRPGPAKAHWDLDEIYASGIKAILSLDENCVDTGYIQSKGFFHQLNHMPDSIPPSAKDIQTFQALLPKAASFINRMISSWIPTLVHCHGGRDRTSLAIITYLVIYCDQEPRDALLRLRNIKPTLLAANGYEALLYQSWIKFQEGKIKSPII
jgi:hypothetical protein